MSDGRLDRMLAALAVASRVAEEKELESYWPVLEAQKESGEVANLAELLVAFERIDGAAARRMVQLALVTPTVCRKCGATYTIQNFDPGRKYACRKCMADLALDAARVCRENPVICRREDA